MRRFGITDLRLIFENDMRFLSQFERRGGACPVTQGLLRSLGGPSPPRI